MSENLPAHPIRPWIQAVCPSPARLLQELILKGGLKTGLDIGCGANSILTKLRPFGFRSTGIDVSRQMLDEAREADAHDEYMEADFLALDEKRQFDVVVLSEVIEHFTKEDGCRVLEQADRIANRLIYVGTPNGFLEQSEIDGNPYQKHLSGWTVDEFRARGYEVYGIGIKGLRGSVGRALFGMERTVRLIERMTRIVMYRWPKAAFELGALKRIG